MGFGKSSGGSALAAATTQVGGSALAVAAVPEAQVRKVIKEELNDIKDEIRELISADIGQTTHEQPRALGLRGLDGATQMGKGTGRAEPRRGQA